MGIFHSATVGYVFRDAAFYLVSYVSLQYCRRVFFLVNVVSAEDCCEKGKLEELYRHSFM